ncbi:unnamed protein product [Candida verbasci]|uniref:Protein FMP52, mitochondrial n=1 Tax=Candida verbasci TaxID=1227364 RepID=A0A9W4XF75_9ASCO|nr:unnamed protein product [Candida verbasci]
MSNIIVLGATGLVGTQIIKHAEKQSTINKIITLTRSLPSFKSDKIESIVEENTGNWPSIIKSQTPIPEAYISSFGTTKAKAGGAQEFKEIDYGINYENAKAAKELGCSTCVLISAQGANSKSPFFYLKTKGELEDDIKALNFDYFIILRPGVLIGERKDSHGFGNDVAMKLGRFVKGTWFQPLLNPIDVSDLGEIAIDFANRGMKGDLREKILTVGGSELIEMVDDLKVGK